MPKTILLKLGGEVLGNEQGRGLVAPSLDRISEEIFQVLEQDIRVGVVVGGGNFWRGRDVDFIERVMADRIGILGTVMNGLALQAALERHGVDSVIQSPLTIAYADSIQPREARRALQNKRVVIFVGGVGAPLVSTDIASAIRGVEIEAEILLKASYVDGVYDKDPKKFPDAKRFETLTFEDVLTHRYQVMDLSAFEICAKQKLPILVFDVQEPGNLIKVLDNPKLGTLIS
jgi:uridylate kinase